MSSRSDIYKQGAEIFFNAASYIEEYGWQISGMSEYGRPRCSMGALASAHREAVWDKDLSELMYDELSRALNGVPLSVFNEHARDSHDVVLLFRKVGRTLEQKSNISLNPQA